MILVLPAIKVLKVFPELKVTQVLQARPDLTDKLAHRDHQVIQVHLVSQVIMALEVYLDWLVKVELQDGMVQQAQLELRDCLVSQDSLDLLDRKVPLARKDKLVLQVIQDNQDSKDNKDLLELRVCLVLQELRE